jgi:hypothetical protein
VKIHHLGIVISDLDQALSALGLDRTAILESVFDPMQKNALLFIHLPDNNLWHELVEPKSEDASSATFARKFTIGLHHLAMSATNFDAAENHYTSQSSAFTLGCYHIAIISFGGAISTLFFAVYVLALEFVKNDP